MAGMVEFITLLETDQEASDAYTEVRVLLPQIAAYVVLHLRDDELKWEPLKDAVTRVRELNGLIEKKLNTSH
jgi:hypothetical protein